MVIRMFVVSTVTIADAVDESNRPVEDFVEQANGGLGPIGGHAMVSDNVITNDLQVGQKW
jgi:hypothetical protein